MSKNTITFGDFGGDEHTVGDEECTEGLCGCVTNHYPRKCECGGLKHAEYGDTSADDEEWWYVKCDRCGSDDI